MNVADQSRFDTLCRENAVEIVHASLFMIVSIHHMSFMEGSFLARVKWQNNRDLTISFICSSFIVKFEGCHVVELLGFESSDPNYSVQPDGSVYAEQDVANLSEPVQFMVTARGHSLETHIWETTVKLALAGHPSQVPHACLPHISFPHHIFLSLR